MAKKLTAGLASIFTLLKLKAQTPEMYPPPDPEPVDVTTVNVILYVLVPVILVIAFILYRRWVKKRKNNEQ
ncbi:MAG: hypothetical protein ACOC1J_01800 [Prolixibacteraceae bacterium]